jgi:C4-dicarboxylate-binding protein DctP
MSLTRRNVFKYGAAAAAAGVIGMPAIVRAAPRTLIFAHHLAPKHIANLAVERFAGLVKERTNGDIVIENRPAGQMFNLKTSAEAIQVGTLDMCWTDFATLGNWEPYLGFIGLPFLFRDYDHVKKVLQGPVADELRDDVRNNLNIEVLAVGGSGFRVFLGKVPVQSAADCKGIKLRIPEVPVWVAMARALAAVPTPIPGPEIYTALQTGVVDAIETPPDSMTANKWYEVAKHSSRTNHMYTEVSMMASRQVFESLGEAGKIIDDTAKEVVHGWMWDENLRLQKEAWDTVAQNTTAIENPDRDSFVAAMAPVIDDFIAQNGEKGKHFVDAVRAA